MEDTVVGGYTAPANNKAQYNPVSGPPGFKPHRKGHSIRGYNARSFKSTADTYDGVVKSCADSCRQRPSCKSFDVGVKDNNCYLQDVNRQSVGSAYQTNTPDFDYYERAPADEVAKYPGYLFDNRTNIQCGQLCDANPLCVSFNYNTDKKSCYLNAKGGKTVVPNDKTTQLFTKFNMTQRGAMLLSQQKTVAKKIEIEQANRARITELQKTIDSNVTNMKEKQDAYDILAAGAEKHKQELDEIKKELANIKEKHADIIKTRDSALAEIRLNLDNCNVQTDAKKKRLEEIGEEHKKVLDEKIKQYQELEQVVSQLRSDLAAGDSNVQSQIQYLETAKSNIQKEYDLLQESLSALKTEYAECDTQREIIRQENKDLLARYNTLVEESSRNVNALAMLRNEKVALQKQVINQQKKDSQFCVIC